MNKVHISLNVTNVNESQKFYESFLKTLANKVRSGYVNFDLNDPTLKLAIQKRRSFQIGQGKVSHLGIQVPTPKDVDTTINRLSDEGFYIKEEKDEVCCFAKQDKVWVQDPDGNRWEVYAVTDEMKFVEEQSRSATKKQTSCC